jgi:CTP synthase (UTP-ammonia lyase)
MTAIRIAIVGDHDPSVVAHRAAPRALALAAASIGAEVEPVWVATEAIGDDAAIARFDGYWCVPATPYRSEAGALRAIRFARMEGRPFLGTCGGFQHAMIEHARAVLGWDDAQFAETAPGAPRPVIAALACPLVEVTGTVNLLPGTRLQAAYGVEEIVEGYHCRFGINPEYRDRLLAPPMRLAAIDASGDVRAAERIDHPFFVGTLFQPERAALDGRVPPIVAAFLRAARRDGGDR